MCTFTADYYMRKGVRIFLENHEKPAATRDWTRDLWLWSSVP